MSVPSDDAVKARWDLFAPLYDEHFRLWSSPAQQALVAVMELDSACAVLEVACGAGHGLATLRAEMGTDARLVAVDLSPEMVQRASPRATAARASVSVGDAQRLPAEFGASFDRAVANLCLHIVPDADAALRELARVLAPEGLVGLSVWGARADSPLFTMLDEVLAELASDGTLPAPDAPRAPPQRSNFYLGADDAALRAKVASAGFVDVVSWHVPCVWPRGFGANWGSAAAATTSVADSPGLRFARSWLDAQLSSRELQTKLSAQQNTALLLALAAKAQALLDSGSPIACDVVLVLARKP